MEKILPGPSRPVACSRSQQWQSFCRTLKKQKILLLFTLPAILTYVFFSYFPMYGVVAAFQDFDIIRGYGRSEFVGLRHFEELVWNPDFLRIFGYSIRISLVRLLITQPIPIIFALLLNEIRLNRFKKFVQTVTYLPHFISWVIIGGMVYVFLASNGPINTLVTQVFHRDPIPFLAEAGYFVPMVILSGIWKEMGFSAIFYLAALSAVDMELYEAGVIDGASRWKLTWHITIPAIIPTIVILYIYAVGGLAGVGFEQVFNLQNSLIREETQVIDTFIFYEGIRRGNMSFGVAMGLFQGFISFTLIMLTNTIAKKVSDIGIF